MFLNICLLPIKCALSVAQSNTPPKKKKRITDLCCIICVCRGPAYGYRGKVVLAFEENRASKIGVRFDRTITGGNDLGGSCEVDHGFFCAGKFFDYHAFFLPFILIANPYQFFPFSVLFICSKLITP